MPRVTEILKYYSSYDKVPKEILNKAAERGTIVHAICANIAKGAWVPDSTINPTHLSYVESFRLWSNEVVETFDIIEKRYSDEDLYYTGQLDFVITTKDGKKMLVDLKTSCAPQKTYPIQMAAYYNLLKKHGEEVEGALIVYINKSGTYPSVYTIEDFTIPLEIFNCALKCWKHFNPRKFKKDNKEE